MSTNSLAHSLPVRILHWLNAAFMGLLITTGLYISNSETFPFFLSMDMARKIHFVVMYLLIYGFIFRAYYSCASGGYRDFLLSFRDLKELPKVIAYYLFLTKNIPEYKRYNPAQKLLYIVWGFLVIVQAATGFALYKPETVVKHFSFMGGPVELRQSHLLISWFFIVTFSLHIYLACISGWQNIKSMIIDINEEKETKTRELRESLKNRV